MNTSEDEYDAYTFDEFTEQDFADIDSSILVRGSAGPSNQSTGGPEIIIEVEQPADNLPTKELSTRVSTSSLRELSSPKKNAKPQASPFQRHRSWNGILSVSDLVSPAWCELQFDYGLRQKRNKKLDQRPASFTSGEGKKISVEKKVAAQNDKIVKRGKSVHKVLEKEIRPTEVRVDITTDEERWALRLINMLSCLHSLMSLGCAREMPVFGMVHDQVVVGVIDELQRKPVPEPTPMYKRSSESIHATPKAKRTRRTPSPSQQNITSFFPHPPSKTEAIPTADERPATPPMFGQPSTQAHTTQAPPPSSNFTLHLLDTKTRRVPSLPDHADTISSRLQLMLYHRLLAPLLFTDPSHQFDFQEFWQRLRINPTRPFSTRFMNQAGLIIGVGEAELDGICLDGLTRLWRQQVALLDVSGLSTTLELIYRNQPKHTGKKEKKDKGKGKEKAIDEIMSQEEIDLARAIEESMKSVSGNGTGDEEHDLAMALAGDIKRSQTTTAGTSSGGPNILGLLTEGQFENRGFPEELVEDQEMLWALQKSLLDKTIDSDLDLVATDSNEEPSEPESSESAKDVMPEKRATPKHQAIIILGTKEFVLDDQLLDNYLMDILQWWLGYRQPKGVEVALSKRCFSCEYMDGCEWREKKANEAIKRYEKKRALKKGELENS